MEVRDSLQLGWPFGDDCRTPIGAKRVRGVDYAVAILPERAGHDLCSAGKESSDLSDDLRVKRPDECV